MQPKTRMMKWLTDRHFAVESSFTDFFEAFIEEHKEEHRLDLSTRSIYLNTRACILLGYKDCDPCISIYDVIERALNLYD